MGNDSISSQLLLIKWQENFNYRSKTLKKITRNEFVTCQKLQFPSSKRQKNLILKLHKFDLKVRYPPKFILDLNLIITIKFSMNRWIWKMLADAFETTYCVLKIAVPFNIEWKGYILSKISHNSSTLSTPNTLFQCVKYIGT